MTRIAVFASGSGSNAERIIRHFSGHPDIQVVRVLTNNPQAGVIQRARDLGVPCRVFDRKQFINTGEVLQVLQAEQIDFVVLAGFLWLVPPDLIRAYRGRMVNIHPALLPHFGGKGFYGEHVHRAVIASGQPLSGITIHAVNEHFDSGDILFQAGCHVDRLDAAESLADKIHALEHRYFPVIIEKLIGAGLPLPVSTD
jgi:phosphoribosylglycinamide formyltransferase-1